ncbi:hypothetical protein CHS0354_035564 [Potamilus streckersoni]|uniref:Claudin n=1 Tax=Potamilus streckersoni TaxID=2493646 RepID=A0AAE0RSP9_9BIVA|nr:hypothetical protein CHS0354_035564 [Potamilus streckersoni]
MHKLTIAGVICGAVSSLLCTIAIASPRWLAGDLDFAEVYIGLWTNCSKDYKTGHEKCGVKDVSPDWILATLFLEMAGLVLIFGAVLLETVHVFIPRYNHDAGKMPGLYAITSGLCITVGAIIWAAKYKGDELLAMCHLSGAFSLAIISAVMSVTAGSLFIMGWRAQPREHSYMAL